MSAAARGRRPLAARLVFAAAAGVLVLGPALVASPAHAATSTPTPIAEEPPGGATCSPDSPPTDCQQEGGSTPTPTPSPTSKPGSSGSSNGSSTGSSNGSSTGNLPQTGGTPSLASTGPDDALLSGLAGAALLASGALLVVTARRRTASAH